MFNWFKNRKINKEIKQNLSELKQMILDIKISETSSEKELTEFYSKVAVWDKVLTEKQVEFFAVMGRLTPADKLELLNHIESCITEYGNKMIKLNELLISCLDEERISTNTKVEIVTFGKDNMNRSEQTINTLRSLAKYIALSK